MMSKINTIKEAVQGNQIKLDISLIELKQFTELVAFFTSNSIQFQELELNDIAGGISLYGKASCGNMQLEESEFLIYKNREDEEGFQLEWFGNLRSVSFGMIKLPNLDQMLQYVPATLQNLSFDKAELNYDGEFLSIKTLSSNHKLTFPLVKLALNDLGFFLEWDLSKQQLNRFLLASNLEIGSTIIGVELNIPTNTYEVEALWNIRLSHEFSLENGIKDLADFLSNQASLAVLLGDGKLENMLPEAIQQFKDISITDFELIFDPLKPSVYCISVGVTYFANWTIFPNFTLDKIGFNTFITFHDSLPKVTLKLFGRYSFIENWYVQFGIELSMDKDSDWLIRLEGYADLESIQQLEAFKLFKLESLNLPPEWLIVRGIRLNNFELVFNPSQGKVKRLDFAVEMNAESTIIPGITVKNPEIELKLNFEE